MIANYKLFWTNSLFRFICALRLCYRGVPLQEISKSSTKGISIAGTLKC